MILIVSLSNDLHALAVQRAIADQSKTPCHIVESDAIAQRQAVSLRLSMGQKTSCCRTAGGHWIDLSEQKVLWLRRPAGDQNIQHTFRDQTSQSVVQNDCVGALRGLLAVSFKGKWVSSYQALLHSSDKLAQLDAASRTGWRIPDTLVSQKRSAVLEFFNSHSDSGIIIKTIVGTDRSFLLTRRLLNPLDFEEAAYEAAPAIYQQYIPGRRHIRMVSFGGYSLAASIDSDDTDWRPNLNVPINGWKVPEFVHQRTRATLDLLGLEMGVIDLKETPQGELVWLEVNPQGQFLFLDPLTNLNLAENFAQYLIDIANNS